MSLIGRSSIPSLFKTENIERRCSQFAGKQRNGEPMWNGERTGKIACRKNKGLRW